MLWYCKKSITMTCYMQEIVKSNLIDLHTAANIGEIEYFKENRHFSLEEINTFNANGWTPLMYAASRGASAFAEELIRRGARCNCANYNKVTSLMLAVSSGDQRTVKVIARTEQINLVDLKGWSALFYAVYYGREPAVVYLIDNGADINIRDKEGITPVILATKLGIEFIVQRLVSAGADVSVKTPNKETALTFARLSGNVNMEKIVTPKSGLKLKFGSRELKFSPNQENIPPSTPKTPMKGLLQPKSISHKSFAQSKIPSPAPSPSYWLFKKDKTHINGKEPVLDFLTKLGLEKYWPLFRDEEVDFETLLTFEEKHLQEIGVRLYGPRRKIYVAIQDYKKRLLGDLSSKQNTFV